MNYNETRSYLERELIKLGWDVRLDKAGYKKIFDYTGGDEDRLGQLYYKLVGIGSQQPKREITELTVNAALAGLQRMEEIVNKPEAQGKPKSRIELDRLSIDQLAKALEIELAREKREEKEEQTAEEKKRAADQARTNSATGSSLPRILVVDDSSTIRAAVTKALKNDFSFVEAPDGETAWRLLASDDSIQLVITDLDMPKLDGYELIKRIRSDRTSLRISEMPVVVVTTIEETNAKLRALVAGANDFVTKSTDTVELRMRVMARYQIAKNAMTQERKQASARRASPAASPAPTPAISRNVSGTSAVKGNGSAATAAQALEAGRPVPEMPRPAGPAGASSRIAASAGRMIASRDLSSYAEVADGWKKVRAWFSKANSLSATTLTTLGGTLLIVIIIVAFSVMNRPDNGPAASAATTPATEAAAAKNESPEPSQAPLAMAPEPAPSPVQTNPVEGDDPQAASPMKADEQTPVRKSDGRSTDASAAGAVHSHAPAHSEPGKTHVAGPERTRETSAAKKSETRTLARTDTAQGSEHITAEKGVESNAVVEAETNSAAVSRSAVAARGPAPTVANAISSADLARLVNRFQFVYEAGDIEQFVALFDDNVETNDTFTKAGLRQDYAELFKTTDMRVMTLQDVTWDTHDNTADGWGNFKVKVRKVGAKDVSEYKGSLTFHVEKVGGRILIKRLYHGQWRAG